MGCSFISSIQSAVGKVADVVVPIAAVIPGPWQVPAQIYSVAHAVEQGGIEAAIPALLSVAVSAAIPAGSMTGSLAADAAIKSAGVAAATGGDPIKAALMAAASSGLSEGSDTYSPAAASPDIFTDSTVDAGGLDGVVVGGPMSPGYSMSDITSLPPLASSDPYSFSPSYNLADNAPSGAGGLVAPPLDTAVWDGSSPVDYSLPTALSGGLQIPSSPSLPSMGGGQGLTVPVEGGTVGSLGFTPTGASPVLGNLNSFINDPAVTGQPIMATEPPPGMTGEQQAELLKSLLGLFGGAGLGAWVAPTQQGQQPDYQPASTMPNYSPEYFQQIQQKYDQIVPAMPADVATPLSQWYNKTPYQPSIVSKLFGVI